MDPGGCTSPFSTTNKKLMQTVSVIRWNCVTSCHSHILLEGSGHPFILTFTGPHLFLWTTSHWVLLALMMGHTGPSVIPGSAPDCCTTGKHPESTVIMHMYLFCVYRIDCIHSTLLSIVTGGTDTSHVPHHGHGIARSVDVNCAVMTKSAAHAGVNVPHVLLLQGLCTAFSTPQGVGALEIPKWKYSKAKSHISPFVMWGGGLIPGCLQPNYVPKLVANSW